MNAVWEIRDVSAQAPCVKDRDPAARRVFTAFHGADPDGSAPRHLSAYPRHPPAVRAPNPLPFPSGGRAWGRVRGQRARALPTPHNRRAHARRARPESADQAATGADPHLHAAPHPHFPWLAALQLQSDHGHSPAGGPAAAPLAAAAHSLSVLGVLPTQLHVEPHPHATPHLQSLQGQAVFLNSAMASCVMVPHLHPSPQSHVSPCSAHLQSAHFEQLILVEFC
eukprot:CAMPEP_0174952046 /NCGR_PEP_ID=MMETSP1355-20121228/95167_1 /TAXON_ID=464990 /ORGANISM="Hemiselmis tepida, Strain CCMP443" /LENGTH=223 /DNA_ID=CAMNT_0016199731 /DNA_START=141 /DNA_END=813 /DNA_ORIENTATION=+